MRGLNLRYLALNLVAILSVIYWNCGSVNAQSMPFGNSLDRANQSEPNLIRDSHGLAERDGNNLLIWFDRGQGLSFKDWSLLPLPGADGDAESCRYLGGTDHYQVVETMPMHDVGVVKLIHVPTGAVRSYDYGIVDAIPHSDRIVVLRDAGMAADKLLQITRIDDSGFTDEFTCDAPQAPLGVGSGMYAKPMREADNEIIVGLESVAWSSPTRAQTTDLGLLTFVRDKMVGWKIKGELPNGAEAVKCIYGP